MTAAADSGRHGKIQHGGIGLSLEVLRAIVGQLGGEVEVTAVFNDRRVLLEA